MGILSNFNNLFLEYSIQSPKKKSNLELIKLKYDVSVTSYGQYFPQEIVQLTELVKSHHITPP